VINGSDRAMGYNTSYSLSTDPESSKSAVTKSIIARIGLDPFDDKCKWYDWADDMPVVSRLHPETIISLHGVGEESDDQWVAHYLNGEQVIHRMSKWDPPGPPTDWLNRPTP
jgi:hypothetical protein